MERKIFVSHSSKHPSNVDLLGQFCSRLEAASPAGHNYSVVYDRDCDGTIVGGDDWYQSIDQWMIAANAAVILFSKAALFDSDWVKKEAAILSWRRELDPDFVLIPILLEGLTPKVLSRGLFGVLRINKRQCVEHHGDLDATVASVHRSLDANAPLLDAGRNFDGSCFEPLEGVIALLIASIAGKGPLASALRELGVASPSWPPDEHKRNSLAAARFLLEDTQTSVQRLSVLLNAMHPRPPAEGARQLFSYLAAMWVQRDSAAGLPSTWLRGEPIALNGNHVEEYSAERYCERAWCLDFNWKLVRIGAASNSLEEMFADIDATIARGRALSPERIRSRIEKASGPFVLLLPLRILSQGPRSDELRTLRTRYPGVIVMLDVGSERPSWLPDAINSLEPALDLGVEEFQIDAFDEMHSLLERLYGSY